MNTDKKTWNFDQIFPDPDMVGQSEYLAIYEVVEGFREDPETVRGILEEFRGWAEDLLQKLAGGSMKRPLPTSSLGDEAVRRLAVSIVDACGDVFYDPSEFNDPWDQEEPEGIAGATNRLLDWVTDNVENGLREALRLHKESGHVIVHVTPFEGESGVLVDGRVVYIAPTDSQHAVPAGKVATALANVLGVTVVELDLRPEMEAEIEANGFDNATWDNVPAMVVSKLGGGHG